MTQHEIDRFTAEIKAAETLEGWEAQAREVVRNYVDRKPGDVHLAINLLDAVLALLERSRTPRA